MANYGTPTYTLTRSFDGADFDDLVERTRAALADQGFGVLTEIDVKATLDKKLGVTWPNYLILGACNPKLAHQALLAEPGIGVLLPCNVVVAEDGDQIVVSAVNPASMFSVVGRDDVEPIAAEVKELLEAALGAL